MIGNTGYSETFVQTSTTRVQGDTIFIPIEQSINKEENTYRAYLRQTPDSLEYFVLEVDDSNIVITANQSQRLKIGIWYAELEEKTNSGVITTLQRSTVRIIEDYTKDTEYPLRRDFIAIQGDTWNALSAGIVIKINGEYADLTVAIVVFQISTGKGEASLIEKTYAGGGILISDPTSGELVVPPFDMTIDRRVKPYYWSLKITLIDNTVKTVAEGYLTVI